MIERKGTRMRDDWDVEIVVDASRVSAFPVDIELVGGGETGGEDDGETIGVVVGLELIVARLLLDKVGLGLIVPVMMKEEMPV